MAEFKDTGRVSNETVDAMRKALKECAEEGFKTLTDRTEANIKEQE